MSARCYRIKNEYLLGLRRKIMREHIMKMIMVLVLTVILSQASPSMAFPFIWTTVMTVFGALALIYFAAMALQDPKLQEINERLGVVDRDRALVILTERYR